MKERRQTIGRAEKIVFPELSDQILHARIDTGAKTSAISATAEEIDGRLKVNFLSLDGQPVWYDEYTQTVVASSNGQAEKRYKIKVLVSLGGRKIRARFTLANRTTQTYPVLIGRNVLRGKFIVDVAQGDPLTDLERQRSRRLQRGKNL